jgi:voltage-gated potassium channel
MDQHVVAIGHGTKGRSAVDTLVNNGVDRALVRSSGADSVVTSSDAVGRLLGLSSLSPTLGAVMEDLVELRSWPRGGRAGPPGPRGREATSALPDQVIAVVRAAAELPWAARPGTHGESTTIDED